jgi:hypothetical protein
MQSQHFHSLPMTRSDKRLVIASVLVGAPALAFWSRSRYPDLNRKAAVGGDIAVNGLAFDVAVQGSARDPFWTKVAVTAVNRGATNLKGMTFGLLIGDSSGLNLGRALAVYTWPKYESYFDGTMPTSQQHRSGRRFF